MQRNGRCQFVPICIFQAETLGRLPGALRGNLRMAVNFLSPVLLCVWFELCTRACGMYAQSLCRAATPQEGILGAVVDLGMSSPNDFFFFFFSLDYN